MNDTIEAKKTFHESLKKYAHLKRFFERFSADPEFKKNLQLNRSQQRGDLPVPGFVSGTWVTAERRPSRTWGISVLEKG